MVATFDHFSFAMNGITPNAQHFSIAAFGQLLVEIDVVPPEPVYPELGGGGGHAAHPAPMIRVPSIRAPKTLRIPTLRMKPKPEMKGSVTFTVTMQGNTHSKTFTTGPKRHKILIQVLGFINTTASKTKVVVERFRSGLAAVIRTTFSDK